MELGSNIIIVTPLTQWELIVVKWCKIIIITIAKINICIKVLYQHQISNQSYCAKIIQQFSTRQDITQHKTNLPLLLLTPAAGVAHHLNWPPPQSHAPHSYGSKCYHPPPPVSVVYSSSPGSWWLLSGHLQVEIFPIKNECTSTLRCQCWDKLELSQA